MKHAFVLGSLLVLATMTTACGPDAELVASGKIHTCNLKKAVDALAADPENAELKSKMESHKGLLDAVVGTADEGGRAALKAAIDEAAKAGCD